MRDFVTGIRLFGRGAGLLVRSPRLLLIGVAPALLTALLLLGGMIALVYWIDELAALATPFADGWSPGWRTTVRGAVGVALFGGVLAIALISFTALTVAIGGPFYEHIAEKVEDDLGAAPSEAQLPWWRLLGWGLRDGLLLVLRSLMFTIPLLLAGFIPVLGQTVVPVLLVLVTAWFLALELVAVSFYRRGRNLKQRRELLSTRRALAVGLGTPTTLLSAIPFAAIIVMPVAFVGGVLVAQETLRTTTRPARD
ncbi:MAG TPA: EI24 domain-containing protein [Actinophytocola sp.]|uniref:EI24 domain-containing protein n=1 Tax=Actinophytocola sp. TaxID=1872138 RepID=UPI002DB915A4|nr:EI24 domain-containing protein [Actinophytocola sp.]HEU5471216.1 EI24 domain-containing protein [Actinophytocola sp.]